jgi:hypothetical protein
MKTQSKNITSRISKFRGFPPVTNYPRPLSSHPFSWTYVVQLNLKERLFLVAERLKNHVPLGAKVCFARAMRPFLGSRESSVPSGVVGPNGEEIKGAPSLGNVVEERNRPWWSCAHVTVRGWVSLEVVAPFSQLHLTAAAPLALTCQLWWLAGA